MAGLTPARYNDATIEDFTWLADFNGLEEAESGTLHAASLRVAGGHLKENWIRSGTPLGKITAAGATKGQFGLFDTAATDGRQFHYGFLKAEVQLVDRVTGVENTPLSGAVLNQGQILTARLPVAFDPAHANANTKHFIYR